MSQWGLHLFSYCIVRSAEEHMDTWYPSVLIKLLLILCINTSRALGEYFPAEYFVICLILN